MLKSGKRSNQVPYELAEFRRTYLQRLGNASGAGDLAVPTEGVLGDAPAGGIINVDEPKAFAIAVAPLEIVGQRPVEISPDVHAPFHSLPKTGKIPRQEVDPVGIVDLPVQIDPVIAAQAVFCDVLIGLTQQPPKKPNLPNLLDTSRSILVSSKQQEGNQYGSGGADYICGFSGTVQDRGAVPGVFIPAAGSERVCVPPLAVRRSITPSTAGTCASARSAVSRLL